MLSANPVQSTSTSDLWQFDTSMTAPQSNVRLIYLQLEPENIAPVKFIFEAYEEIAIVRTVDRHKAVIVLMIAPDFFDVAREVLHSLQSDFPCTEISRPTAENDDWLMRQIEPL